MFDIIAVAIVAAMLALSLGVFELREINVREVFNILLETLPFYFATILLNTNYYTKGTFGGKATKTFISVANKYSVKVNGLTGWQISKLPDFCDAYNTKVLEKIQCGILRTVALTLDEFNVDYKCDAVSHGPLKVMSKHDLIHLLGHDRAMAVIKAKNVKIKGISANVLLSNLDNPDVTDLGPGEREMAHRRTKSSAITSFLCIFVLTLIGIKNVMEWGWVGVIFVIFKLLYIVARSYMQYFDGYQDITVSLVNHISRKTDIIKEFESEYPSTSNSELLENGNN